MNALKLHIDEFEEANFFLLAIHSQLDDYRLAYFINKNLDLKLSKSKNEIFIKNRNGETSFSRFLFEDEKNDFFWDLFENKSNLINLNNTELFGNANAKIQSIAYLLPEHKKVDYFLKIDSNESYINIPKIIQKLNTLNRVSTVYNIETKNLKSKHNLIF